MSQSFRTLVHNLLSTLRYGTEIRYLRLEFEGLNTKAADLHAVSAKLFGHAAELERTASHMEARGEDPTLVTQRSQEAYRLADAYDASGDEMSEKALMPYIQIEQRIGARKALQL